MQILKSWMVEWVETIVSAPATAIVLAGIAALSVSVVVVLAWRPRRR